MAAATPPGTSHNPVFDGRALAHRGDVVVVTVNHRLGALGFTNLAEFAPEFAQSGVVGMMDLVAALQWVHDNIENFGGDPSRVLIFGQSGGRRKSLPPDDHAVSQRPVSAAPQQRAELHCAQERARTPPRAQSVCSSSSTFPKNAFMCCRKRRST